MANHPKDYHDYVFRNGKLVAEFEEMYRNCDQVPWHRDKVMEQEDVHSVIELLRDFCPFDEIHDLSCGLGYFLEILVKSLGVEECDGFGYNISETAVVRASRNFPKYCFSVKDLTRPQDGSSMAGGEQVIHGTGVRRLFALRGTLWYVFPQMADVVKTVRSKMLSGDKLLVAQNFPPLKGAFYRLGKEVIPNHLSIIEHFSGHFYLQKHLWFEDKLKNSNDNWFIGLFSLRQGR